MSVYNNRNGIVLAGLMVIISAAYQLVVAQQVLRLGYNFFQIPLLSTVDFYPSWISIGIFYCVCTAFCWVATSIILRTLSAFARDDDAGNLMHTWNLALCNMLMQFAAGVLAAVLFAALNLAPYVSQVINFNDTSLGLYWMYLAQALAAFIIGWPSALHLFMAASYVRAKSSAETSSIQRGYEMSGSRKEKLIMG